MKYLKSFQLFERKGNYQLYHKTSKSGLKNIIKTGYIIAGGLEKNVIWWNTDIRKNVFPNMTKNKPIKTISATRNFNYLDFPALELDVEKISDKYKIVPYSENPDFYLYYMTKYPLKKDLKKILRDKKHGDIYWKYKTDKNEMDFGIAEELIVTDKLDVGKYVKRIILQQYWNRRMGKYVSYDDDIIKLIKEKYPHIEIVEVTDTKYINVKKALNKEKNLIPSEVNI